MDNKESVQHGKFVELRYSLRTLNGVVIEDITGLPPIRYKHGEEGIHQSLQKKITGMKAGEEIEFHLTPDDATELDQPFLVRVLVDAVYNPTDADGMVSGNSQHTYISCDAHCECKIKAPGL